MPPLTDQERDVARLVAEGFTDKQIGGLIGVGRPRVTQVVDAIACKWKLDRSRNLRSQITRRVTLDVQKTA